MRVIFMGTPDFAVGTLEALRRAGHEIVLAVTQPDKPKGRGKSMQFPPVKEAALSHGILPKEILEMPKHGCVNVHASLLPKYRGAAPIQWAVINGERVTGVTTMRMDQGLDTGDMILKEEVELAPQETGGSLFDRLAQTGAALCVRTLEAIEDGTAVYTPQDHEAATHTMMIKKQLGKIDWNRPAQELECLIRGLNPWPSAYTSLNGKTLKIWKAVVEAQEGGKTEPGIVTAVENDRIVVQTAHGLLQLLEVQLEGKKRMTTDAFLRGFPVETGTVLGKE